MIGPDALAKIPLSLPLSWDDYEALSRSRDGFSYSVNLRITAQFPDRFDKLVSAVVENICLSGASASDRTVRSQLRAFLADKGDLSPPILSATLRALGLAADARGKASMPAPIDVFRREWPSTADADARCSYSDADGTLIWRMIPTHPNRNLDACLISSTPEVGARNPSLNDKPRHVHAGEQMVFVEEGTLIARFLGLDDLAIPSGNLIIFDPTYPHTFVFHREPQSVRAISIFANLDSPSGLIVATEFPHEMSAFEPNLAQLQEGRSAVHSLECSMSARVSIALHTCPASIKQIARRSRLSYGKLARLKAATLKPSPDDIRELSYLLRIPESYFYMTVPPMDRHSIYISHDVGRALRSDPANWPPAKRRSHASKYAMGQWRLKELAGPRITASGGESRTRAYVFCVEDGGELQTDDMQLEDHHQTDPGEEFLYVLEGECLVKFGHSRQKSDVSPSRGILREGDAIWLTSELQHTFAAMNGRCSMLHVRLLYPSWSHAVTA